MKTRTIGPGDDVEAWCTKCQMDLNHRIIAVVDGRPKRVICLTCNSHHNYHPPKTLGAAPKKTRVVSAPRALKPALKSTEAVVRSSSEWKTFMKDYDESSPVKPYSIFSSFSVSEFVEHPVFGLGKVIELAGAQKITVVFKEGRKTLVCNKPSVSDE